jgi:uncharacterized protein YegP (UPF0339 family)
MTGKYVITRSGTEYLWNLKAGNGEKILTSERYSTKDSAKGGIESCKTNSPKDERYERRTSSASQPYFVLKAGNGEVIGTSEMYSSTSSRDNGIKSCKENGPSATADDQT